MRLSIGAFFGLTILLMSSCSGGSGDSQTDDDESPLVEDGDVDGPPADGDGADGDEEQGCETDTCDAGLYCDPNDGLCKTCTEDRHCGAANPLTGITPICREGRCVDLVCGGFTVFPDPPTGVELPNRPLEPAFTDGMLFESGRAVFPIGIQPFDQARMSAVRNAGFNLVLSNGDCCQGFGLEYQTETVLYEARNADLYAALRAVWPPDQIEGQNQLALLESLRDRGNEPPLLFWIGADRAASQGLTEWAPDLEEYVLDASTSKLFAVAENTGADLPALTSARSFYIATLDPAAEAPGGEISRVAGLAPGKSVWARIPAQGINAETAQAIALHAIGQGAMGIIFELAENDGEIVKADAEAIAPAAGFLRRYGALWLSPRDTEAAHLQTLPTGVVMLAYNVDNKSIVIFLVNAAQTARQIQLVLSPRNAPYCLGRKDQDLTLHLTRETSLTLELPAKGLVEIHFTEAAEPEG
ncbi:MAG: hypothetical protein C4523_11200 [Myxococcales bacterium]|nr:MAG: hypothetical protein C4523_11200 [Myxococcales bacterium]